MRQYSKRQITDLIKEAINQADQDMWIQIKKTGSDRKQILAAADCLGYVEDAIYRQLEALE